MTILTLTTDFGTRDYYVAAVKGVILSIAPHVRLVDVTHDVEPHNVAHGAFLLRQIWPWYPPGTIHLAVVDPGVGSTRRIIVARVDGRFLVAPDNGLVTFIRRDSPVEAAHVVENPRYTTPVPSATFHGRDIMAPVAANLANGVDPHEFGSLTDQLQALDVPFRAQMQGTVLQGSVLYVDRFGTLITNIHQEQLGGKGGEKSWEVYVNGRPLGPIRSTFSDVAPGEALAFPGSDRFLEVAVNRGSAVERFGPPEKVVVELRPRA